MALFLVPPFLFIYPASIKAIVPIWYKPANPYSFISLWFPEDSLAPNAPKYLNISSLLNPLTDPFPVNVDEMLCAIFANPASFLFRFPVFDVGGTFLELESLVLIFWPVFFPISKRLGVPGLTDWVASFVGAAIAAPAAPPRGRLVFDGEYPFATNLTSPPFQ